MSLAVDHVLIAVRDLESAAARLLTEHGLGSYPGGSHTHGGTANRIVPLGESYLELISVVDPVSAAGNERSRLLEGLAGEGDRPAMWCVRTDDIEGVGRRLGLPVIVRGRRLRDGGELTWRAVGVDRATAEPTLPFFIGWSDADRHPRRSPIEHPAGAVAIASIEVTGDGERLNDWLGGAELPVRVVPGPPAVRAVALSTATGTLELGE